MNEIISESPFLAIATLNKARDHYMNTHILKTDILPSQYYMLLFLYYEMGSTQTEIAKACMMNRSGVSRAFKDFENNELIERKINENNKRAYNIKLTPKGKKTAEFLIEKEKEWYNKICKQMDIPQDILVEKLSKINLKTLDF